MGKKKRNEEYESIESIILILKTIEVDGLVHVLLSSATVDRLCYGVLFYVHGLGVYRRGQTLTRRDQVRKETIQPRKRVKNCNRNKKKRRNMDTEKKNRSGNKQTGVPWKRNHQPNK